MQPGPVRVAEAESRAEGDERAPVLQWIALGLAPATYALHLQIGYALIPWVCTTGQHVWLQVVDIVSILLALAGAVLGRHVAQRTVDAPEDGAGPVPRTRFIGDVAVGVSVLLAMIIIAQWIASLILSPCQ